jgi:hypothetical protein
VLVAAVGVAMWPLQMEFGIQQVWTCSVQRRRRPSAQTVQQMDFAVLARAVA